MSKLSNFYNTFKHGNILIANAARKAGFKGILSAIWSDLVKGMSKLQAIYLIILSLAPLAIELYSNGKINDWVGLIASTTGIMCVIYVSFGRASNYLFGTINAVVYLILSINATFYGEVITTLYFFIMQPVGLWLWLVNALEPKHEEHVGDVKVRSLNFFGWIKWLAYTALIWLAMGFAYKTIGSARPFRDSITDGTNYTGQMLMNNLYWEQWLFWIATNLFSIYLWWGSNIQVQGMYWVYTLNSLVGMIVWFRNAKK